MSTIRFHCPAVTITCRQYSGPATPGYDYTLTVSAALVKTGAIVSGPVTTIPKITATHSINNQSGSTLWGKMFTGAASGSFNSIARSVTNSTVRVDMPKAFMKNMASIGATTGATPVNLSLD
ncbi:hypothetical protein AWB74_01898 [Caballeronia arvi]|uniref:Uncharacterized protein n=1 Tax=Caballeronia arvi TaxID=1777135 RepID=A0A158HL55_9BURK|nr:hypothetical protein [Caballeronia arvi]SAL44803.1 hypothetical protein AWB74_01898 [Caballeronia arvi]